jgi:hypothetical protein
MNWQGETMLWRRGAVAGLLVLTIACGGGNPASPSGGSGSSSGGGSGSGGGTSGKGTLTAVVDGVAYTGIVNAATNVNDTINIASNTTDLTRSISFAVRPAAVGTTSTSLGGALTFGFIASNGTTVTGAWGAAGNLGSGTLTITTLTSTSVSGSFSFTAVPAPGASAQGATGTKTVTSGSFTAQF